MEILPVHVKESPTHEAIMGAGWVSRTWEKEMIRQGQAEIAELVATEKDFCPVLKDPKVIYGDREAELLKITQEEMSDIFIEGAHFTWTPGEIYKKLHTKLYLEMQSPVILVRTLRKVNQAHLLCLTVKGTQTLVEVFQKIWKNCSTPLLLSYPAGDDALRETVENASKALTESGRRASIRGDLTLKPGPDAGEVLSASDLVAIALERGGAKDNPALQWLSEVKTSSLLAFY
jgi:hypothetical protein